MKHMIFAAAICPLATPLWAEVIPLNAPVTAATIYSQGATLTRSVAFSTTAGSHDLLVTNLPDSVDPFSVRVAIEGATLGAVTVRRDRTLPNPQADSPELAQAKANLENAKNKLHEQEDARADVLMRAEAAKARLAYLSTLQGPTDTAASPETLTATLALIGQETLAARREDAAAEREARRFEKELEELREDVKDATQTVEALTPTISDNAMLAIAISSDTAAQGTLTLTHLSYNANWLPAYDVHLNDSDTPTLSIKRGAFIAQHTGEDWQDVSVTLSTSRPDEQSNPSHLTPKRHRIEDKPPAQPKTDSRMATMELQSSATMMEPVIIEEDAGYAFGDGINATYVYPTPVAVTSGSDALRLSLGKLDLTPETFALANPMFDATAFYMAEVTNDSGELLLDSYQANFYLNGTFIGQEEMPLIAEGDTATFSFGPINGLRLSDVVTDRVTGDKGVITTRNERSESRILSAENLTKRDWKLRLLGRVPYSEQEDLVISYQARPTPAETNYDDQRGILMWEHTLTAGDAFEVDLSHTIQWPTDKILR